MDASSREALRGVRERLTELTRPESSRSSSADLPADGAVRSPRIRDRSGSPETIRPKRNSWSSTSSSSPRASAADSDASVPRVSKASTRSIGRDHRCRATVSARSTAASDSRVPKSRRASSARSRGLPAGSDNARRSVS